MKRSKESTTRKLEELVLPGSKLKFCSEQLSNVNFLFRKKLEEKQDEHDQKVSLAKSIAEKLIQRLLCGVAVLDKKFSSKYLISLHDQDDASRKLKYLLRIDSLSMPSLYEEDAKVKYNIVEDDPEIPAGYARLRLYGSTLKTWSEFANSSGYLRRDRVQSKLVELLAKATTETLDPLEVDESTSCGCPGKVVDASTLGSILKIKPENEIYYGNGGLYQFPDPRDFRLAIVDEPEGIRISVEFLSHVLSNVSLNVRVLIGLGVDSWPMSTDFPFRIPLGHSDCFLYHAAAKTGMYLIGFGVHSSAWQIRFPAAEETILKNYNQESTVRIALKVLYLNLEELNRSYDSRRRQISYNILNRYVLRAALLDELESDQSTPTNVIINWSPIYLSTIVLKILDKLIVSLRKEHRPNYFFKKSNLLANPGHLCDDDYLIEAQKVQQFLVKLFDDSLIPLRHNEEYLRMVSTLNTETFLLCKWKEIIDGLAPPKSTRGRRMCLAFSSNARETAFSQYTQRQLEYIGMLLKIVLNVKAKVWKSDNGGWIKSDDPFQENPIEDVIYILVTILEQAKDTYTSACLNPKINMKLEMNFESSASKLIDLVKKDKDIITINVTDDVNLVKVVLKWLYKAMDQNRKYFAPILRPYLNVIFATSHGISWHLDQLRKYENNEELKTLGIFAKSINDGKSPAQGLVEGYNKNWNWAKQMLGMIENGKVRLVLTPEREKVFRHVLSATSCRRGDLKTVKAKRTTSFSTKNYFDTIINKTNEFDRSKPIHCEIRDSSPLTYVLKANHRSGNHRCCGDVFDTLLSLQKLNIFQEASNLLPENERAELLESIQKIANEKSTKTVSKVWSKTLPYPKKGILPVPSEQIERYTTLAESAGVKNDESESSERFKEILKRIEKNDSLLGSVRAVRMKENYDVVYLRDSFKINTMSLLHRNTKKTP